MKMSRAEKIESSEAEIDWLSRALASLEKDEIFCLAAEVDGEVVASSNIDTRALEEAGKRGLKGLTLCAFASNERAIHVYEKIVLRRLV